jgi:hypothetical protein
MIGTDYTYSCSLILTTHTVAACKMRMVDLSPCFALTQKSDKDNVLA